MFLPNSTFPFAIRLFKTRAPPAQGQPTSNIPKTDTATEQHASDPDAALNALAADVRGRKGCEGMVFDFYGGVWEGPRGGHHVGVGGEKEGGARGADGGGEDEAWFGAVDDVPEDGVDEGEG
jgi:hypothetical protein